MESRPSALSPGTHRREEDYEKMLRPQTLDAFIGQQKIKDNLRVFMTAALQRGETLDHVLLSGPPGLGKCITADSLVLTGQGWVVFDALIPPGMAPGTTQPLEVEVYGVDGLEKTSHLYASGRVPTRRITTAAGFTLEGTPHHPVLAATPAGPQWKRLEELTEDDAVAIGRGLDTWGVTYQPLRSAADLKGSGSPALAARPAVSPSRREALSATASPAVEVAPHVLLDEDLAYELGLLAGSGQDNHAARAVLTPLLKSPRAVVLAFLRGLFEACGQVVTDGVLEMKMPSEILGRPLHLLLAQLGIIAHRTPARTGEAPGERLRISGPEAVRLYALLHAQELHPSSPPLIYWDRVDRATPSEAEAYDFVVPTTHSFVANGFFNHNTTLAYIIAEEMGAGIITSSGPVLDKPANIAGVLTNLNEGDVLFIDEIHRLSPVVEEYLYSAMEDYHIDIMIDSGPNARSLKVTLEPFTLVGATTRKGLLTAPLRARFGIDFRYDYYTADLLQQIVLRSARILGVEIDVEGAFEIARRSRGTPRIANRLLRRTRDFAEVEGDGRITLRIADHALNALDVDEQGLDDMDARILLTLIEKFGGGPTGLTNLAVSVGEDAGTIEEVYEPYLIQEGFLERTARGRIATPHAYSHFGLEPPAQTGHLFE